MFEIIDMPPIFYTQVGFAFDVIFMLGKFEIAGDTYQMIVFDVRSFKMEWAGLWLWSFQLDSWCPFLYFFIALTALSKMAFSFPSNIVWRKFSYSFWNVGQLYINIFFLSFYASFLIITSPNCTVVQYPNQYSLIYTFKDAADSTSIRSSLRQINCIKDNWLDLIVDMLFNWWFNLTLIVKDTYFKNCKMATTVQMKCKIYTYF